MTLVLKKAGKTILLVSTILLVIIYTVYEIFRYHTFDYSYRLTVTLSRDGKQYSGSSVFKIFIIEGPHFLEPINYTYRHGMARGEGVYIALEPPRAVVVELVPIKRATNLRLMSVFDLVPEKFDYIKNGVSFENRNIGPPGEVE